MVIIIIFMSIINTAKHTVACKDLREYVCNWRHVPIGPRWFILACLFIATSLNMTTSFFNTEFPKERKNFINMHN